MALRDHEKDGGESGIPWSNLFVGLNHSRLLEIIQDRIGPSFTD
jgi:hypothetical protein